MTWHLTPAAPQPAAPSWQPKSENNCRKMQVIEQIFPLPCLNGLQSITIEIVLLTRETGVHSLFQLKRFIAYTLKFFSGLFFYLQNFSSFENIKEKEILTLCN